VIKGTELECRFSDHSSNERGKQQGTAPHLEKEVNTAFILPTVLLALSAPEVDAIDRDEGPATIVLVSWQAWQSGDDWYIRDGDEKVKMPDEKTARKTAKKFNRIEEQEGSGVYDGGNGPCSDPSTQVLC
jgi:hypothetical protein